MKKILTLAAVVSACSFSAMGKTMINHSQNPNEISYQFMYHGFRLANMLDNPLCLTMTSSSYTSAEGYGEASMIRCARAFNDFRPDLGSRDLEFTEYNEIKIKGEDLCLQAGEDEWHRAVTEPCDDGMDQKWRFLKTYSPRAGEYTYNVTTADLSLCLGAHNLDTDHNAGPVMLKCDENPHKDFDIHFQLLDLHNVQYESGIELYSEPNYQGDVLKLNTDQANLNDFNTIGSYKIPQWYEIRFFEEKNMQGRYFTRNASRTDEPSLHSLDLKSVQITKTPLTNPDRPTQPDPGLGPDPEPEQPNPELGQNEVVLYVSTGFTGSRFTLSQDIPQIAAPFRTIRSFEIPDGWTVRFYEGANYTGTSHTRNTSNSNASIASVQINSFRILSRDGSEPEPSTEKVVLYTEANYQGHSFTLDQNVSNMSPVFSSIPSYKIPQDWSVRFYDQPNYQGNYYTRNASTNDSGALADINIRSFAILSRPTQQVADIKSFANSHVILYTGANLTGTGVKLDANTGNLANFKSFSIPAGWTVRFFQNQNYGGGYYTVNTSGVGKITPHVIDGKVKSIQIISK